MGDSLKRAMETAWGYRTCKNCDTPAPSEGIHENDCAYEMRNNIPHDREYCWQCPNFYGTGIGPLDQNEVSFWDRLERMTEMKKFDAAAGGPGQSDETPRFIYNRF